MILIRFCVATLAAVMTVTGPATAMSLRDAVSTAVTTNPSVLESAANRRARDQELRGAQGAHLPTLNLGAEFGPERADRPNSLLRNDNDVWRTGRQVTVTVRQLLFDGFESVNQIYQQSARVDGAALRVLERSEATALDAIEAYIDVIRHGAILREARRNVENHRRIVSEVSERFSGGETGAADLSQAKERVAATEIVVADVNQALRDTKAKFRRVVGKSPKNLKAVRPTPLPGKSINTLIANAIRVHPRIKVAMADVDAAGYDYKSTKGNFFPQVSLEGNASIGHDIDAVNGRNNDYSAKVVMSWNLFNGGVDLARRNQLGERLGEAQIRVDLARREVSEALDRSWTAVMAGSERIRAIKKQLAANRGVVEGYRQEYNIGQRTLLDVLNAENALFNSKIDLLSAQAIYTFSTYQLRATYGNLLGHIGVRAIAEATGGRRENVSIFPQTVPFKLEPLRKF